MRHPRVRPSRLLAWWRRPRAWSRAERPDAALQADAARLDRRRAQARRAVSQLLQDAPQASCLVTPDTHLCAYHPMVAALDHASVAAVRRAARPEEDR
jgi:hypothetical protein